MRHLGTTLSILGLFLFGPVLARAQCLDSGRDPGEIGYFTNIFLVFSEYPEELDGEESDLKKKIEDQIARGITQWMNSDCYTDGAFPEIRLVDAETADNAGTRTRVIDVGYIPGSSAEGASHPCAKFTASTITLHEQAKDDRGTVQCLTTGVLEDNVAHELGHVLGLKDLYDSNCGSRIMSQFSRKSDGTINLQRIVQEEECQKVDETTVTKQEMNCHEQGCPADCRCSPVAPPDTDDPVADLPDLCDRVEELCEDPGGGTPVPWWLITESSPDRQCSSTWELSCEEPGSCEGTVTETCFFVLSAELPTALAPRDTTVYVGPATGLDAPGSGDLVKSVIDVSGWAADPEYGVSSVALWLDDQPISLSSFVTGESRSDICQQVSDPECPNVGFSGRLDTRNLPDGSHTLQVVSAEARSSHPGPSYFELPFQVDNTDPSVSMTSPASGSKVKGSVTLSASASDASGIKTVRFRLDGGWPPVCSDSSAPYSCTWDTTTTPDGAYTITAEAIDEAGNVEASSAAVTVDNTLPKRYVDRPYHQQVVYGTNVKITGWAIDASGIAPLSFKLDGSPLPLNSGVASVYRKAVCDNNPDIPDPRCPYVGFRTYFDSTEFSNGTHTLTVTVIDEAGNQKNFNRSFIIDNPPITLQFNPVADAYALQAYPNYNYGSQTTLAVRTTSDGNGAYSFLKFQVSGVEGPVVSARLKVRNAYYYMNELYLYQLQHSSWSESTLTWNYFPGPGPLLDYRFGLAANTWYSFDVSAYVTGDGTYSVGFAADNPSWTYLFSRESSYAPVLEVSYEP